MSANHSEMAEEQKRAKEVIKVIEKKIEELGDQTGGLHGEIVSIKRDFWDDVTVNFEDSAEAAETHASMKQQAEVLSERERSYRHAKEQLLTMKKLQQSPYFGRIDFVESGERTEDRIYLGVGSLLDDSGEHYLIYDWRAPVSSLYYDYGPGPCSYNTPSGSVGGEMTLKRQFIIRGNHIRSMFDTGVTIGDELLQEVLGNQSDAQMKSIVATIQREQNLIIRNERARLLIVQGAAGSGKTSAALQRVAYLLYRYRETLNADQIVLFSPNPMFNSYVATVLPELGEQNMGQTTYQQYLEHRLGRSFTLEDPFEQMEYTLTGMDDPSYEARIQGIQYKSSAEFMRLIDDYAHELGEAGMSFKPVKFRGRTLVSADEIAVKFYALNRSIPIANRLRETAEWLLKELTRLAKLERKRKWVEAEIELLDQEEYLGAYQDLRRKSKFSPESFDDYQAEKDYLSAMVVQERFKRIRKNVKRMKFISVPAIYMNLFRQSGCQNVQLPDGWARISDYTLHRLQEGIMPYEDATPYLYLQEKLEGFQVNTSVKHVFIDEAQDYSFFQFAYLKRIFPMSRLTVLGDLNQSIFAHSANRNGFAALAELYKEEETERIELLRSYRSTRPIVAFTSRMISGGDRIEPFNRDGKEPEIAEAESDEQLYDMIASRIGELLEEGAKSVAVICKTAQESERVYGTLLATISDLRLIAKETVAFEPGAVVIPAYLAKGVEFDAVIIPDASEERYSRESERKLFYTACTRAMHELYIYYQRNKTPFLQ